MVSLFLMASKKRSIVYIDGFNFYYALLRSEQYRAFKWLDFELLFRRIRNDDEVVIVRYFTAYWPDESGERHRIYTRALSTRPLIRICEGQFKRKSVRCDVTGCAHAGRRYFDAFEEKETDVNIALAMLDDAYQCQCDRLILVTADTDLVPAVKMVRSRHPKLDLQLYVPGPEERFRSASELRQACHTARIFPAQLLGRCQLPDRVETGGGDFVQKPQQWQ
jgi:uncharacterized LabA/DUF88 family protein